jgi:para-aminobenzoate synthetase component 1
MEPLARIAWKLGALAVTPAATRIAPDHFSDRFRRDGAVIYRAGYGSVRPRPCQFPRAARARLTNKEASRHLDLPYFADPCDLAERLEVLGDVTLLDSGGRDNWDIACVNPRTEWLLPASADRAECAAFAAMLVRESQCLAPADVAHTGPFRGGLIGLLSYELGRRLQGLKPLPGTAPLAVVRHFPWAVVQDRARGRAMLVGGPAPRAAIVDALAAEAPQSGRPFSGTAAFHAPWNQAQYRRRFDKVLDYIHAGDCYQMNLGQRYSAAFRGERWSAYRRLRAAARAPFSACLPLPENEVLLSASPERFLRVEGDTVQTRPIKGTRPRHADPQADRAAARELRDSEKERAENLMIVDLLRNDIGRFCAPGSVRVECLFDVESFATVHHLVSTVAGQLREDVTALELLFGCLPGGSITGAPKYRAMQLIDELEDSSRELWCGTLFYLSAHGRLDSSILIRSLYSASGTLHCWAGGGLVADSDCAAEFRELTHKVGPLLRALEDPEARSP